MIALELLERCASVKHFDPDTELCVHVVVDRGVEDEDIEIASAFHLALIPTRNIWNV